jgi:Skp family chaperone for outer membrane proteins
MSLSIDAKRYLADKPCKRCATFERFSKTGNCVECHNALRRTGITARSVSTKPSLHLEIERLNDLNELFESDRAKRLVDLECELRNELKSIRREFERKKQKIIDYFEFKIESNLTKVAKLNAAIERQAEQQARQAEQQAEQQARQAELEARQQAYLNDPVRLRNLALSKLHDECAARATLWADGGNQTVIQQGGRFFAEGNKRLKVMLDHFKQHFPEWNDITPKEYWDFVIRPHHTHFKENYSVYGPYFGSVKETVPMIYERNIMITIACDYFKTGLTYHKEECATYTKSDYSTTQDWFEAVESYREEWA